MLQAEHIVLLFSVVNNYDIFQAPYLNRVTETWQCNDT